MRVPVDPKVDFAFKAIFGAEENKDVLIDLLNSVLTKRSNIHVKDVDIINPYNDNESEDGKQSIVDIKAKDDEGRTFQIEIQLLITSGMKSRMLWTWSDIFHRQLKSGQPFKQVNPTISIWFLDNNLFKEVPDQYHHEFAVMEKQRHELLCDQLNIQIIEMQKWVSGLKSNSALDAWLQFLNCAQELEIENLPQPLQKPQIKKKRKNL